MILNLNGSLGIGRENSAKVGDCIGCGGTNYPAYNENNMQYHPDLADKIKHWVGGWASARNIDEAGTAVGKAARDAVNFIGRNIGSLFGGNKSSGPPPNRSGYVSVVNSNILGSIGVNSGNPNGKERIDTCPYCLDPSTIGHNLVGSYPGGDNPRSYNGDYNYSYVPNSIAEYPAIGHDRRYDNIHATGVWGLFTDSKAIGADWKFVKEELEIAFDPVALFGAKERLKAGVLGVGLGFFASFKTVLTLSQSNGYMRIKMWYIISNAGVNNTPVIHKH
ncbi:hypothetical protein [Flavobacterium branchiicola]|uniref:Uncharacterized protein n=1 Tax=Flavobacterium branchiicola TaxID=1114875 RepID=A0ABV9PMD9_9FLAO|nr:hypothetical protein [Flavobacterium branchiicola]MBS7256137.1 hypothetical protein [Flavobacterium branchiicola]